MGARLELTRWPLKDSAAQPASTNVTEQCCYWSKIAHIVVVFATSNERSCMKQPCSGDKIAFFNMSRRIKETQEGRFPMNLSEMCRTPLSHNDRVSGGCQISHFCTLTFSFCFHSTLVCLSLFFFLSRIALFVSVPARASLSLSFTHGSGFGSGTRCFSYRRSE